MIELTWEGKYDRNGRKVAPLRVALPFQTVETVNESTQERQRAWEQFRAGYDPAWRNRLIWGDKKYVLPALLPEFAGQVDLVYISPPAYPHLGRGAMIRLGDDDYDGYYKEPSAVEQRAYRETWGRGTDSWLQWFYNAVLLLRDLLRQTGSLFVKLDYYLVHYARLILDEIFGLGHLRHEYVLPGRGTSGQTKNRYDTVLWYSREPCGTVSYTTIWSGIAVSKRIESPSVVGYVWGVNEDILWRIVTSASCENDLVLDCFVDLGATAVVAEKLNRRWISADLSRFAIHITRKRLLAIPGVKPFVVQNLGKYERQLWQAAEFGEQAEARLLAYRRFILDLYHARPLTGPTWLHGVKGGRLVHVGAVDSPVSPGDITQIATEFRRLVGTGADAPATNGVDVLGWDFAFELNEVARQQAALAKIDLRFLRIPREVLEKKAVEQGDIRFFELAALAVDVARKGRSVTLTLTDFVIPLDDVPDEVQRAITAWAQWIDYWAVDWDNHGDTFHNQWQTYRTRQSRELQKSACFTYDQPGTYTVVVKVIDLLGNDTTKTLKIEVP
jgi:adenine-specific DNA-methyltransferase